MIIDTAPLSVETLRQFEESLQRSDNEKIAKTLTELSTAYVTSDNFNLNHRFISLIKQNLSLLAPLMPKDAELSIEDEKGHKKQVPFSVLLLCTVSEVFERMIHSTFDDSKNLKTEYQERQKLSLSIPCENVLELSQFFDIFSQTNQPIWQFEASEATVFAVDYLNSAKLLEDILIHRLTHYGTPSTQLIQFKNLAVKLKLQNLNQRLNIKFIEDIKITHPKLAKIAEFAWAYQIEEEFIDLFHSSSEEGCIQKCYMDLSEKLPRDGQRLWKYLCADAVLTFSDCGSIVNLYKNRTLTPYVWIEKEILEEKCLDSMMKAVIEFVKRPHFRKQKRPKELKMAVKYLNNLRRIHSDYLDGLSQEQLDWLAKKIKLTHLELVKY